MKTATVWIEDGAEISAWPKKELFLAGINWYKACCF